MQGNSRHSESESNKKNKGPYRDIHVNFARDVSDTYLLKLFSKERLLIFKLLLISSVFVRYLVICIDLWPSLLENQQATVKLNTNDN